MKLTVNLHEKLRQYNEVTIEKDQEELILKEANSIIESHHQSDLDILRHIGMANSIDKAQSIKTNQINYEKFGEVYDISAIKKLAVNYRLRFLRSNKYKGSIDPLLAVKLKEFCAKNGINPELRYRDEQMFYILAPANSFNLEKRPKDPIMFYKIDSDKYAFVHKWGNDFSPIRLILKYPLRSIIHYFASWFLFLYTCVIALSNKNIHFVERFSVGLLLTVMLGAGVLLVHLVIGLIKMATGNFEDSEMEFSNEAWDSEYL